MSEIGSVVSTMLNMSGTHRKKASALQRILAQGGPEPVVDGLYGRMTSRAYQRASGIVQSLHDDVAQDLGYIPPVLASFDEIEKICSDVASSWGVPSSYMTKILMAENQVNLNKDEILIEYDGTFKGLGQFNSATWESVVPYPFADVVSHARSAEAVCRLYLANKATHASVFSSPFTDNIAYLYHNQGAGSARRYLDTGNLTFPKQSELALAIFAIARRNHYGEISTGGIVT
jgi:hypothetical protein